MKLYWNNLSPNNPRMMATIMGSFLLGGIAGYYVQHAFGFANPRADTGTLVGAACGAVVGLIMLVLDDAEW